MKLKSLVLFLNGSRGEEVLKRLLSDGYPIKAIITPPNSAFSKKESHYSDLNIINVQKINDSSFLGDLKKLAPELFIVAGFSSIFKDEQLSIPTWGTINLHAGPLPKYRGGSPLNWQIINGEPSIEISIIKMDHGIDTGDILIYESFKLEDDDNIASVHQKANNLFPQMVSKVLKQIEDETLSPIKQDNSKAIYRMQRGRDEGLICFRTQTAKEVHDQIRALTHPYPGAYAYYKSERIYIYDSKLPKMKIKGTPGRVCYIQGKGPYIACSDYSILITNSSHKILNGITLNLYPMEIK